MNTLSTIIESGYTKTSDRYPFHFYDSDNKKAINNCQKAMEIQSTLIETESDDNLNQREH